MDTFFLLFNNLIPLYVLIALGYIAGRFFAVERQTLGALGIYIIMPIIAFGFVAQLEFQWNYIALPFLFFIVMSGLSLIGLKVGRIIYPDARANLLAIMGSAGNTGYFGLPLILTLMTPEWAGLYIFIMMGAAVYEATFMYYIAARGRFSVRQSLVKLARFPTLYAITAGIVFNLSGQSFSPVFETYWGYFQGTYIVIGMMIVGAALSRVDKLVIAPRFIGWAFLGKFIIFPAISVALIMLDKFVFGIYQTEIHKLFFVLSIVPPAANIAAFAVEMDLNPEKAATTILIGTILALFTIPLMLILFDHILI